MALKSDEILKLPVTIVTVSDLTRLRLELERLTDFLVQGNLRAGGKNITLPRVSKRLDELASLAGVTLLQADDCEKLLKRLESVAKHASRVHLSFATDPSDDFLAHIIKWFRENVDPHILLSIGLQPSIAAGFIMRTPSHYYDCSLRSRLDQQKHFLSDALRETSAAVAQSVEVPV